MQEKSVSLYKKQIFITIYGLLFIFLIFSEYFNAFYNIQYDALGVPLIARIRFAFKPMVLALYLLFTSIVYVRIIHYLKPLFMFLEKKEQYQEARVAAVKIPWVILFFQVIVWAIGTSLYYFINNWTAESGIPFSFGLSLKVVSGFISALYVVFVINLILKNAKFQLGITDIQKGEDDKFSRYKDYLAIISAALFLFTNFLYMAYYFAFSPQLLSGFNFAVYCIPMSLILFGIAIIPIFLSKKEYQFQVSTLADELKFLAAEDSSEISELFLINFDELGELAVYVNRVVVRFNSLLEKIRSMVNILSSSSHSLASVSEQSNAASNQQAAAVAEIVSTMEDSNHLSRIIGDRALEVLEKSQTMLNLVENGNQIIDEHLRNAEKIRAANDNTIEFISTLNEDITTIWEIVNIINSIADQVRIIAFNAELEASAAGEAGKNFEIVASEIRRLADNTVSSTTEIKDKIGIIEKAGHGLMKASENATELIESGWETSKKVSATFDDIQVSVNETTGSSQSIEENIRMQIQGFEQILQAMKQISDGASDFAESTSTATRTAIELKEIVETLKDLAGEKKEKALQEHANNTNNSK